MGDLRAEPIGQRRGDNGAMALSGVTLETHERDAPVEPRGELVERTVLGKQIFAELAEVALKVTVLAVLMISATL